jgi:tetratricopeptide (TPR) repeat protein
MFARAQDATLKPANTTAQGKRDAALAEAYNYKAELLLDPEVARPEEALALLEGFEATLPGQPGFIESVKSLRVRAHCRLGHFEEAEAELAALLEFKAGSAYGRVAAFEVAQSLAAASTAARTAGDTAAWRDLLARAADAMWTYNRLAGFVSFANLVSNGEWFAQVGRPADAARAYQQSVDSFDSAGSGVTPAQLDEARLGLAGALTALHEFGKARPYWQDLVARRPGDPRVLEGAARAFGGWLELDSNGQVVQIDGSGDYQRAFELWSTIHQRSASLRPQRIWWESKLGALNAYYRLGASQPQALLDARKVLDQLKLLNPGYDEETIGSLAPEQRYEPLFKPLFEYLDKRVPR